MAIRDGLSQPDGAAAPQSDYEIDLVLPGDQHARLHRLQRHVGGHAGELGDEHLLQASTQPRRVRRADKAGSADEEGPTFSEPFGLRSNPAKRAITEEDPAGQKGGLETAGAGVAAKVSLDRSFGLPRAFPGRS